MEGPLAIVVLFIGLPWLIFHYVTRWKSTGSLSQEDERLLDDLHLTARRLDERLHSIERIIAADNPGWRPTRDAEPPLDDRPLRGADPLRDTDRSRAN